MSPPDFQTAATLLAAIPSVIVVLILIARTVAYLIAPANRRPVIRKARRIRRTWARTAIRVGLAHSEQIKAHAPLGTPGSGRRTLVPAIRVQREAWGVRIDARTLGRLGLQEFQAAADHLANAWKVPFVRVEQHAPSGSSPPGRRRPRPATTPPDRT
jgi:S-DNA-T family DNA segregation ATPase FtsK/SpoIIIE